MTAFAQPGGGSKHVRQARKVKALMRRYRASGVSEHAVNFARGVLIGGIIVLFVWLIVG
jgi:hypothetical protein